MNSPPTSLQTREERLKEELVPFHIRIPASILARFNEYTHNPLRNKPRYAERSRIITELLVRFLDELDENRKGKS